MPDSIGSKSNPGLFQTARLILGPERRFYSLVLVYAVAIGGLTLSVPLSVQVLITTVTNTAIVQQVIVLAAMLLALLLLSAFFTALQIYIMELFERRFFSRIVSEVALRLMYASFRDLERINRDDLVNRYFDIMTVQKSLPPLLTGILATGLQTIIGITVTSFYHPAFLVFNVSVLLIAFLVYRVFDRAAGRTSIDLSDAKYRAARWLESLTRANNFFKSRRTIEYAIAQTLDVRDEYVDAHKRHFRFTFAQILGFLLLYSTSSAVLLGVGGWLVVVGQLTVGQLVAAELILVAIFYGFTRYGYYLELYYDVYAALIKLSQLYGTAVEDVNFKRGVSEWEPSISARGVQFELMSGGFTLNFDFAPGSATLIETRSGSQVNAFANALLNFARPVRGDILLDEHAIEDFNVHQLRDDIHVIDSTSFIESTIAEYLSIADPNASRARMREVLSIAGLDRDLFSEGADLDQELTPYGYPLSLAGVIKLKLAFALLSRPRIVILTPLFDMLSREARLSTVSELMRREQTTVICFSHRRDLDMFDAYAFWDFDAQTRYASIEELDAAVRAFERSRS